MGIVGSAVGLPWYAAIAIAVIALLLGAAVAAFVVARTPKRTPPRRPKAATPADEVPTATFRLEGEYWTIAFRGPTFRLHDSKGLRYIHRLLETPDVEVHALDLVLLGQPGPPSPARIPPDQEASGLPSRQLVVDRETLRQYRLRVEDLRDQIEEAEANVDPERGARARVELEFVMEEIERIARPGGSPRTQRDETERARLNVTRAIKSSISKIGEQDRSLGHHLDHDIRTGTYCSYEPDPATAPSWAL